MDEEKYLSSLQQMLAQAIALGTKLTDHEYQGVLWNPTNREIWSSFCKLRDSAQEFLGIGGTAVIKIEQLFPLHDEMRALVERGS